MPTTVAVIQVDEGAIFAVDTRGFYENTETESHGYHDKVHEFNSRLFGLRCGSRGNNRRMFEHLDDHVRSLLQQDINLTVEGVATEALRFIDNKGKDVFEIANFFVGSDGQSCQAYKVEYSSPNIVLVTSFDAIGSGSAAALTVLESKFRPNMTEEEGVSLAYDALTHASLIDQKTGGWLRVFFLPLHGDVKQSRAPVLHKYLEDFVYQKSLLPMHSALFVLVHDDYKGPKTYMLSCLSEYGCFRKWHCLAYSRELDKPWDFPYHLHRIEYEAAEVAEEAYKGLVEKWKHDEDHATYSQCFGKGPLTWMKVSEFDYDPAAIVCVESKGMLETLMNTNPTCLSYVEFNN